MAQTLTGSRSFETTGGRIACMPRCRRHEGRPRNASLCCERSKGPSRASGNIKIVLSSDERTGLPFSQKYIMDSAEMLKLCASLEPARANGGVVIARKGGIYFTLTVKGRSAHSEWSRRRNQHGGGTGS